MLPPHPATLPEGELLAACEISRTRRSGPGGQHRNKVETAVIILHVPTAVRAEANERRSQAENRRVAILRLRLRLAIDIRSTGCATGRDQPSPLWQSRRHGRRIRVNRAHSDFPALLAEALDVVDASQFDVTRAAQRLGVSTSQLVGLLKLEPAALVTVNADRKRLGLRRLR